MIRMFLVYALLSCGASAATLEVAVARNGFTGPIEVAVAPREDGRRPEWTAAKTLADSKSSVTFDGLASGAYLVMARGPQPLQRLSAKANLGSDRATVRLAVPRSRIELRAVLCGKPVAGAGITLTHKELRWPTEVETGDDGRFAGELWEPGVYIASVRRGTSAPHNAEVWLAPKPITIDVPDRHVTGRITAGDKPHAGAIVTLRTENTLGTVTLRTQSADDGRFDFFGVPEGEMSLTARAASYLDSDAVTFVLRGTAGTRSVDVELRRGAARAVRVIDSRGTPINAATLIASCDGNVKSMAVTNAEGKADVALPAGGASCAIYAVPQEGSIAIARVEGSNPLVIRMREATSSLRLALKTNAGDVFSSMSLLMRVDGMVVPPAISRLLSSRGFPLVTDEDGSIALQHIPPGLYEFWPYRTLAEGQMLYETAADFEAPISVKVLTGENNATVKFRAR